MDLKKSSFHIWIIVLGFLFVGNSLAWSGTVTNQTTMSQYTDLQEAINAASSEDVLLLEGTFLGSFQIIKNSEFLLTLKGTSETERAIIDAQQANRVFEIVGINTPGNKTLSVILKNLVLQNGLAKEESSNGPNGGCILNALTNLSLSSVLIQNNHADLGVGGGIANLSSILTIENSTFTRNGAIQGGAICNFNTEATISNTLINENTATDAGGGIVSNISINAISNSIIKRNHAPFGGGIFSNGSIMTINTTKIHYNTAGIDGGGLYNYNGATATISSSSIKRNQAGVDNSEGTGGGIYNDGGYYLLTDTTVKRNTPDDIYPPPEL